MGSKEGVLKVAAGKIGITLEEYIDKIESDLKWCTKCKSWKFRAHFVKDVTRGDGLNSTCNSCHRVKIRKRWILQPPNKRIGDKARNKVTYAITKGYMAKAKELKCRDCGKQAAQYHHHLGYEKKHWLDVIPLCVSCHRNRHIV